MRFGMAWSVLVLAFVSAGCGPEGGAATSQPVERRPMYDWGFYNATDQQLEKVYPQLGEYWRGGVGYLRSHGTSTAGPGFDPIPDTGAISWTTSADGKTHQQKLSGIVAAVPDIEHFDGVIWFKFTGEGW